MADPATIPASTENPYDFANTREGLQVALMSLFSGTLESTEADLSKLFTPTFKHYDEDNDRVLDFAGWVKHVKWLRKILKPGCVNLKITQFLRDGNQLAERHISTTEMEVEEDVAAEGHEENKVRKVVKKLHAAHTWQFMEIAEDGRIEWIIETVKQGKSVKDGHLM